MNERGMTDGEIREEIAEVRKDLEAFAMAKAAIQSRILEHEGNKIRYERFAYWSGTQAALHVLIMCESRTRGLMEDLRNNIQEDAQVLRLVEKKNEH